MSRFFNTILLFIVIGTSVSAQEERRVLFSSFEDGLDWRYTGDSILFSAVEPSPSPEGVAAVDGAAMLRVEYDTSTGPWHFAALNLPAALNPLDLTGMRELRMSVYVLPGSQPHQDGGYPIRIDMPGSGGLLGLGIQTVPDTGQWYELVWKIDRIASDTQVASVNWFGGYILPNGAPAQGVMFIDNIYAVRPAGTPDVEQVALYGFNEEDPVTLEPAGWTAQSDTPFLGTGDAPPREGGNYMEVVLGSDWVHSARTIDAMSDFDRWTGVREVIVYVRMSPEYNGEWVQTELVLQSGVSDADGNPVEGVDQVSDWDIYPIRPHADAVGQWKLLLWDVDMTKHKGAFENEGGWFTVSLATSNHPSLAGVRVFYDDFQVSVPIETGLQDWNLY